MQNNAEKALENITKSHMHEVSVAKGKDVYLETENEWHKKWKQQH